MMMCSNNNIIIIISHLSSIIIYYARINLESTHSLVASRRAYVHLHVVPDAVYRNGPGQAQHMISVNK